jgi:hypothetical protein
MVACGNHPTASSRPSALRSLFGDPSVTPRAARAPGTSVCARTRSRLPRAFVVSRRLPARRRHPSRAAPDRSPPPDRAPSRRGLRPGHRLRSGNWGIYRRQATLSCDDGEFSFPSNQRCAHGRGFTWRRLPGRASDAGAGGQRSSCSWSPSGVLCRLDRNGPPDTRAHAYHGPAVSAPPPIGIAVYCIVPNQVPATLAGDGAAGELLPPQADTRIASRAPAPSRLRRSTAVAGRPCPRFSSSCAA